jgi:hypothetical protein
MAGRLADRLLEAVQRPVEVFLGDDQGRGEADRGTVRVLGQHPARGQALADLPAIEIGKFHAAHRPRPRTWRTASRGSADSRSCRCMPSLAERSWSSPVDSIAMTSRPTAQANGLPPNVEPCWPGRYTPRTSREDTTAETGTIPPPSALRCRCCSAEGTGFGYTKIPGQEPLVRGLSVLAAMPC